MVESGYRAIGCLAGMAWGGVVIMVIRALIVMGGC
jgi:hypothetical protein